MEENSRIPVRIQEINASLALAITEAFIQKGWALNSNFSNI